LRDYLDRLFRTSAHLIQWREKDLDPQTSRRWLELGRELARRAGKKLLCNADVESALALGLDGVHLTSRQDAGAIVGRLGPSRSLLVGQSVHSLEEALAAQEAGVDYLLAGPVFIPLSKASPAPPLGLDGLARLAAAVVIPVIALGGVTPAHWPELSALPNVAGFAGISWVAEEIRRAGEGRQI
jgi:thiamine-phosphate pyrophosphorylase